MKYLILSLLLIPITTFAISEVNFAVELATVSAENITSADIVGLIDYKKKILFYLIGR